MGVIKFMNMMAPRPQATDIILVLNCNCSDCCLICYRCGQRQISTKADNKIVCICINSFHVLAHHLYLFELSDYNIQIEDLPNDL